MTQNRCSEGSSAWCVTLVKVLNIWMKAEDVNIMRLLNGIEESALGYIATKQVIHHISMLAITVFYSMSLYSNSVLLCIIYEMVLLQILLINISLYLQSLLPLLPNDPLMDILAEEMGKLSSLEDSPYLATPCISLITTALSHVPPTVTKDVISSLFSVLTQWRENADNIFLYAT